MSARTDSGWNRAGAKPGPCNACQALGVAIVGTALFAALPADASRRPAGSLAGDYTTAIQVAALYCLGAAVATFLLIFLLPRRSA